MRPTIPMRLRAGIGFSLGAAAFSGRRLPPAQRLSGATARRNSACTAVDGGAWRSPAPEYGRRAKPMRMKRLFVCGACWPGVSRRSSSIALLGAIQSGCARWKGVLALKKGRTSARPEKRQVCFSAAWRFRFCRGSSISRLQTGAFRRLRGNMLQQHLLYSGAAKTWANRLTRWTTVCG